MSILVIFITGKQNGGYHRKLPASLHMMEESNVNERLTGMISNRMLLDNKR